MRNAVVTGGTKGIGLAIVKMLLREGYFITLTYASDTKSAEKCRRELEIISPNFEIVCCNQADKAAMQTLAAQLRKKGISTV